MEICVSLSHILFRMASGSRSGGNDNPDYVVSGNEGPTPLTSNSNARFTAILEQLVESNEVELNMQAQIASILQVQKQFQAQMQTPPVPPV